MKQPKGVKKIEGYLKKYITPFVFLFMLYFQRFSIYFFLLRQCDSG